MMATSRLSGAWQRAVAAVLLLVAAAAPSAFADESTQFAWMDAGGHPAMDHAAVAVGVQKASHACPAVSKVPITKPEWQVAIFNEVGKHLVERIKSELSEIRKIKLPQKQVEIASTQFKASQGEIAVSRLKAKQAEGLKHANAVKQSQSQLPNIERSLGQAKTTKHRVEQKMRKALVLNKASEDAYFKAEHADISKDKPKPEMLNSLRKGMLKAQNKIERLGVKLDKSELAEQKVESSLTSAREEINKEHSHLWKPQYYAKWIRDSEKRVEEMNAKVKSLFTEKKALQDKLISGGESLKGIPKKAMAFSDHTTLVKMMYSKLLAAVDLQVSKGIKLADPVPPGRCSPKAMQETLCDYLTRKQTNTGHFRGLPDTILSGISFILPAKLSPLYTRGAVEASKRLNFKVVQASVEHEFQNVHTIKSIKSLTTDLYRECLALRPSE